MQINKGQFRVSTLFQALKFHLGRGRGHLIRYVMNRIRWHLGPRMHYAGKMPDHVDLELSSACNMRCPMCYTITDEFKEKVGLLMMKPDLFKKLIDECVRHRVYSVRLSLRGEPTIHPKFLELATYAKERIPEVSMLTNGLKLTTAVFEELVKLRFDWISISFDGLGETYENIRKPAKYEEMIARIREFKEIKKRYKTDKPVVKIQTVWPAIKENPQAFYDVFEPIVDMVASNPLIDYKHLDEHGAIEYEPNFVCPVLWQRIVVGSNGEVVLCSNDEMGKHKIGNANTETLQDIWNGDPMTKVRNIHKRFKGTEEIDACRECYLPRRTQSEVAIVSNRRIVIPNYTNRPQVVGK